MELHTLSTDGTIKDAVSIVDKVIAYYITSDYSQSNVFLGKVKSFRYRLREHNGDKSDVELRDVIKSDMEFIISRYLPNTKVDIEVLVDDTTVNYDIVLHLKDGDVRISERYLVTNTSLKKLYKHLEE